MEGIVVGAVVGSFAIRQIIKVHCLGRSVPGVHVLLLSTIGSPLWADQWVEQTAVWRGSQLVALQIIQKIVKLGRSALGVCLSSHVHLTCVG